MPRSDFNCLALGTRLASDLGWACQKVRIRTVQRIGLHQRLLGFKEGAATALYDDQQITDLDPLRELDDPRIKELCHQIGKEGHPALMIS